MKKKLIKKVNILNQTTHINFYSNFILYNYLNNYNLKYYFLFNSKRKNYKRIITKFRNLVTKNIDNTLNLKMRFNLGKSNIYLNNQKDKFFKNNEALLNKNLSYQEGNYHYSDIHNKVDNFIINKKGKYLLNDLSVFNTIILAKELMAIIFILNLSKLFEMYKIIILLTFFSIK